MSTTNTQMQDKGSSDGSTSHRGRGRGRGQYPGWSRGVNQGRGFWRPPKNNAESKNTRVQNFNGNRDSRGYNNASATRNQSSSSSFAVKDLRNQGPTLPAPSKTLLSTDKKRDNPSSQAASSNASDHQSRPSFPKPEALPYIPPVSKEFKYKFQDRGIHEKSKSNYIPFIPTNKLDSLRRATKRPVSPPPNSSNNVNSPGTSPRTSGSQSKNKKKKNLAESEGGQKNKDSCLINALLHKLVISEDKSFDEQTLELVSQLEQTETERRMRIEVLQDVAQVFSPILPYVQPLMYGSTLTNIAFKTSDLDIFLYCPFGQPDRSFVLDKGKIIYRSPKFNNIIRVARARVPVIKATHVATDVAVDISHISGQAVFNSLLVKHLLAEDARVRPLAMMISLWSKLNMITGQNRFSSYSIVLLILYYLQNVTPRILPPLKDILYSDDENAWPQQFHPTKITNVNTSKISQLFLDFFKFYLNFKFGGVVISPYLGKEIPVDHFTDIEELTDDFHVYKTGLKSGNHQQFVINKEGMNVQDPIEHNVNTCRTVYSRLLRLFRLSCERTLNTFNGEPQNLWLPNLIKMEPLKIKNNKKQEFCLKYQADGDDWFDSCIKDLKELLNILLVRVSEVDEEFDPTEPPADANSIASFIGEANYNVFNKKFRFPLRMYFSHTIPLEELRKQFQIVINRNVTSAVVLNVKFRVTAKTTKGKVKVTITDRNTSSLNVFQSWVHQFQSSCTKFLTDLRSKGDSKKTNSGSDVEVIIGENETEQNDDCLNKEVEKLDEIPATPEQYSKTNLTDSKSE